MIGGYCCNQRNNVYITISIEFVLLNMIAHFFFCCCCFYSDYYWLYIREWMIRIGMKLISYEKKYFKSLSSLGSVSGSIKCRSLCLCLGTCALAIIVPQINPTNDQFGGNYGFINFASPQTDEINKLENMKEMVRVDTGHFIWTDYTLCWRS